MTAAPKTQLDIRLNGPQLDAYEALAPGTTIFLGWGRGVGKTWFKRTLWWLFILQWEHRLRTNALEPFRGIRITSLAPTLKQWKDINWAGIEEELRPPGKWSFLGAKLDRQSGQIRFPGGSVVRPFPASEYNARTARGMRTDILDADEFDDIDASVYDGIAAPWLSEPWSLGIQILSGTPIRGRHGLWWRTLQAGRRGQQLRDGTPVESVLSPEEIEFYAELYPDRENETSGLDDVANALKRIYSFHATYEDAPETVSHRAVAKAAATTPKATFEREWRANPDAGEGLVYLFDESFHVRQPPPLNIFADWHVGMDHGDVDPGVLLLGGVQGHGNDATLWIVQEWYETGVLNSEWNQRATKWNFAQFWPDPSRADRIRELRELGVRCGEVDNGILPGIGRVAELLHIRQHETGERFARLYVAPSCKNLIREFGLYKHRKLVDGSFDEKPRDKDNHAMDALRYLCVGRFGRIQSGRYAAAGR